MFDHMWNKLGFPDFTDLDVTFIKEMIDRNKDKVCIGRPNKKFLYEVYFFLIEFKTSYNHTLQTHIVFSIHIQFSYTRLIHRFKL